MGTGSARSHTGILQSPFLYGDHHFKTEINDFSLLVWERGVPVPIQGFFDPRFYAVITVLKWGSMMFHSLYGNGECPFLYSDARFDMVITIWK
jgi:hypothetical protein